MFHVPGFCILTRNGLGTGEECRVLMTRSITSPAQVVPPQQETPLRYLDPVVVSRLKNMELRARLIVEGFITGLHKSPYHGFSVEFAEHRPYNPGDALRMVDWKVYAKTDRHYVKQFEEETNLRHYVVLDTSTSMRYRHASAITKLEYGAYLAASLHYLMVKQRDATGLIAFDESVHTLMRPKSTSSNVRHLLATLERLVRSDPGGRKTSAASVLNEVAERISRRSLVVIITDLFENIGQHESLLKAMRHLRYRGHEVIVFHVLESETERRFKFPDVPMVFRDMETGEEVSLQPAQLRANYVEAVRHFSERFRRQCLEYNVDFVELDTAEPYDTALLAYLNKRKRLA
jgi:uncharacterized protein (DUF58 family)